MDNKGDLSDFALIDISVSENKYGDGSLNKNVNHCEEWESERRLEKEDDEVTKEQEWQLFEGKQQIFIEMNNKYLLFLVILNLVTINEI